MHEFNDIPQLSESQQIDQIIRNALAEDIGDGDVTTLNTVAETAMLTGVFLAKEAGVVAGLDVVRQVFHQVDPRVSLHAPGGRRRPHRVAPDYRHGKRPRPSDPDRRAGGAELLAAYVGHRDADAALRGRRRRTQAVILDTRKTVPGLRVLDKWAVRLGGGQNHRIGLYDMAMIKDNHIAAVGGIAEAVRRVRAGDPRHRPIEVEVTNLDQLREALAQPIDRILLDNMSLDQMRQAVEIAAGRIPLEASGNVNLDTVAAIAATGVDFISSGALTHSVKALDISLDIQSR